MIWAIGGPPRVGKSTLAGMLLERDGVPGCPTDVWVSMPAQAAPELGVRHGTHAGKAESARPFLLEFLRAAADGLGEEEPYVVEGDVVTPEVVLAARESGLPVTAVFLGDTAMTADGLRISPEWLEGADEATYRRTAEWISGRSAALREACAATGQRYVETGHGRTAGLEHAYTALTGRGSRRPWRRMRRPGGPWARP
ncbi:hypothetical protein [Streptomyces sp. HNM0574]|uniref:hypothetical protein n=1 Tax=Streptomyces sp. HNM0574 TaxID=2714954 RepID=UPI00146ABCDC|nr:hypothetical protein [Streptomyces sp. HNM0574]NLU70518.1 hypothetical protein [Streptomyces sp. HNM0574]